MFDYDYTFCNSEECPRIDCVRHITHTPIGIPISIAMFNPEKYDECEYYWSEEK